MPAEDPDRDAKLTTLRTMQREGESPRVAELLLVDWPLPDGPTYYATRVAHDILDDPELLDRLDGPIELRLGSGVFLDVPQQAGIGDDRVDLDFWDGDNEFTRLFHTHGAGMRVEVFYYFPDVDLLISEWWGHLQPPAGVNIDRFKTAAQSGFRSSNLPLPGRAPLNGCQAVFGGLLKTQAEIDEGDCLYSAHLGGTPNEDSFGTDSTWLQTTAPAAGDWTAAGYDDSGWSAAVEQGPLGTYPWTWGNGPPPFPPGATAQWIWDHDSKHSFDNATVYFRKSFVAADTKAVLIFSGDNSFTAYLNGTRIAFGDDWQQSQSARVTLVVGETYVIAVQVVNGQASDGYVSSPGGLIAVLSSGVEGVGFGNLDPATGLPYVSCPRNNRAACIARLGDDRSYLAVDAILESHVVNETKGPNITVTARGNETNQGRPIRVVFGKRHVADLDIIAYVVEPDTKHPDQGSVKCLFMGPEGNNRSVTNGKINGQTIAPQHSNYRNGGKRQTVTSFSPGILNYSGTSLFLGVAQGDFTKATADDLKGEVDIEGLDDLRIYTDPDTFTHGYTTDRGWALLHCFRNKRWGYGLDARRVRVPDFIDIAAWYAEIVSVKDKDGNVFTGLRSQFNAELVGRTAQQQIEDICRSGRLSLPFPDKGKLRVVPLRRATELFSAAVFTDKAFFGVLARAATSLEREEWFDAVLAARDLSQAALLEECQSRVMDLFESSLYTDRARTDEEFITDCYAAFLRREPDDAGAAFWLNQLITFDPPELARLHLLEAFSVSIEFINDCSDSDVPAFSDRGDARNICIDRPQSDGGKSTLSYSIQSDADLPNKVVLTYDDAAHDNKQVPIPFEDVDQQLRAGRAFGDTSRRVVQKDYSAFGITDTGEAGRLGNLLLDLGEFDDGGVKNNLRWTFTTWYLETVELHPYRIIKLDSAKLDAINGVRVAQGLEPFTYFRVRSLKRMPDLKVEIECQAYPVDYYERLELLTQGPPIAPTGPPIDDPNDPDFPGRRLPFKVELLTVGHNDDQIFFEIGRTAV
jgi:hypothetical protein